VEVVSLVVYGSVARCEARADSDMYLLVVIENLPRSMFRRLELFEDAEERIKPLLVLEARGMHVELSLVLKWRKMGY